MSAETGKANPGAALSCRGLASGYDDAVVISDIGFDVPVGQVYAVLGKNGMGKTTLLKTVMGFLKPRRGEILYHGEAITGMEPQQLARRAISYIPQEAAIFQDLTVEENLRLGLASDRLLAGGMEKIAGYFPVILERRGQKAGTLSGGEQKMLLMARALIGEPKLMLIDEISEGLQPTMVERMTEALKRACAQDGATILLVEQNVRFVSRVANAMALIKIGGLVEERAIHGTPEDEDALSELMRI